MQASKQPSNPEQAERLLPLLKSIAREVRDRKAAISFLEGRIESLKLSPNLHAEDLRLAEATLATERRALRHAEEELERLGCRLEEGDPERIVVGGPGQSYTFSWKLGDTQIHRLAPADSAA